jgi:hypothetical protein
MEIIKMKRFRNVLGAIALCSSAFVQAEPVMSLITVNTGDPAGYAGGLKVMLKLFRRLMVLWQWVFAHLHRVLSKWAIIIYGPFLIPRKVPGVATP